MSERTRAGLYCRARRYKHHLAHPAIARALRVFSRAVSRTTGTSMPTSGIPCHVVLHVSATRYHMSNKGRICLAVATQYKKDTSKSDTPASISSARLSLHDRVSRMRWSRFCKGGSEVTILPVLVNSSIRGLTRTPPSSWAERGPAARQSGAVRSRA